MSRFLVNGESFNTGSGHLTQPVPIIPKMQMLQTWTCCILSLHLSRETATGLRLSKMDLDDDDSENDSDYVPGAEEEKDMEDEGDGERKLVGLSKAAKRRVTALWLEMQEEDRKYTEAMMMKSINYEANRQPQSEQKRVENEVILSSIFGKVVGKRLASFQATPEDEYCKEDIKKRALESVQKVAKRRKITETRKFAGKEIS